jgi:hypothetical protein
VPEVLPGKQIIGGTMKTKKFRKKLVLKKITVANLQDMEMNGVHGGFHATSEYPKGCDQSCGTANTCKAGCYEPTTGLMF